MNYLEALTYIRDNLTDIDNTKGITQLVNSLTKADHTKKILDLLEKNWRLHSGNYEYPISGGTRDPKCPVACYNYLQKNRWDRRTTYGRNRFDALNLLISLESSDSSFSGSSFEENLFTIPSEDTKLTRPDVYDVCAMFKIDDPSGATQEAIRLLLLPEEGSKLTSYIKARDAINKRIKLLEN